MRRQVDGLAGEIPTKRESTEPAAGLFFGLLPAQESSRYASFVIARVLAPSMKSDKPIRADTGLMTIRDNYLCKKMRFLHLWFPA